MPSVHIEFDKYDSSNGIQYGQIQGNSTLLYIKVGAGGTILGYNNKYIKMAIDANRRYGCSVLVASNPDNILERCSLNYDMEFIHNHIDQCDIKILGMGISKGGLMFLQHAWRYTDITNVLVLNAPLMINTGRMLKGIANANCHFTCLYGSLDPSFPYVGLLEAYKNVKLIRIQGANHHFSEHSETFQNSINYLFESI